jgi:hypothetical protein
VAFDMGSEDMQTRGDTASSIASRDCPGINGETIGADSSKTKREETLAISPDDLERIAATISFPRGVVGFGFKGVTAIELSTSPPGAHED